MSILGHVAFERAGWSTRAVARHCVRERSDVKFFATRARLREICTHFRRCRITAKKFVAMAGHASVTPRDLSIHFTVQVSTFVPTPATMWPISSDEILLAKM